MPLTKELQKYKRETAAFNDPHQVKLADMLKTEEKTRQQKNQKKKRKTRRKKKQTNGRKTRKSGDKH